MEKLLIRAFALGYKAGECNDAGITGNYDIELKKALSELKLDGFKFNDEQKEYIVKKLQEHYDEHGDATTWDGIKMAKRVIRKI